MAYRRDIAYIEKMQPSQISIMAGEFQRLVRVVNSVLPDLEQQKGTITWSSDSRELYEKRLGQAYEIIEAFKPAFTQAQKAVEQYAAAVRAAQGHIADGKRIDTQLGQLIAPIAQHQTQEVYEAEPLAQWNDLRSTTGFWDWLSEVGRQDDIDRVRTQADDLWRRAGTAYDEALTAERDSRKACVEMLDLARRGLPDFLPSSADVKRIIKETPGLQEIIYAAANDPDARDADANLALYRQPDDAVDLRRPLGDHWPVGPGDLLDGINPEMSDSEIKLIRSELTLQQIGTLRSIRMEAYATAGREFPGPFEQDGHRDAFTHAYLHARLSQEFGSDFANRLGNAHEAQPHNPAAREMMDLHNNQVGREVARAHPDATPAELAQRVHQAVSDGRTVVIDHHGHLKYSDTVRDGDTFLEQNAGGPRDGRL